MAWCFIVGSKVGNGGELICNTKAGALAKVFFPEGLRASREEERRRWPSFTLIPPLLSLLCLWQLWPLEEESPFDSWLGLAKT